MSTDQTGRDTLPRLFASVEKNRELATALEVVAARVRLGELNGTAAAKAFLLVIAERLG